MIQEKLALMAIKIDNMRNMVMKVAWQTDQHQSLRTSGAGKTVLRTYRNGSH